MSLELVHTAITPRQSRTQGLEERVDWLVERAAEGEQFAQEWCGSRQGHADIALRYRPGRI